MFATATAVKQEETVVKIVEEKQEELKNDAEAKRVKAETERIQKEVEKVKQEKEKELAVLDKIISSKQKEVEQLKVESDKAQAFFDSNKEILSYVGVRSKNLIPFPYIQAAKELNGIIVTANDNGSVGVSGTATADATIYFDLCVKDFGAINMYSGYVYDNGYVIKDCNYDAKNKKTFIVISVKSGVTVDKIYYPQIELGSTATPYTPYISEFEGVEVSRYGKNLFDITTASKYSGGGTPKWEENNVLAISQTAATSRYISSNFIIPITESLVGKKITVSAKAKSNTGNEQACIRILYFNKGVAVNVPGMSIIAKTYSTEFVNISASGTILELPEDKTGHLCLALYSNAEGTITNGATSYYKDNL